MHLAKLGADSRDGDVTQQPKYDTVAVVSLCKGAGDGEREGAFACRLQEGKVKFCMFLYLQVKGSWVLNTCYSLTSISLLIATLYYNTHNIGQHCPITDPRQLVFSVELSACCILRVE